MHTQTKQGVREALITHFLTITKCTYNKAIQCLERNHWKLNNALQDLEENPIKYVNKFKQNNISHLYITYKDNGLNAGISNENMLRLLNDLQLKPDDIRVLLFAWLLDAQEQCHFTRTEFVNGLARMDIDSLTALKVKLNTAEQGLNAADTFKDFYKYTFKYAKEIEKKYLDTNSAILYWHIVFQQRFQLLKDWCKYLKLKNVKFINEDIWNSLLDFATEFKMNLNDYSFEDAWPTVIDEFVSWYQKEQRLAAIQVSEATKNA